MDGNTELLNFIFQNSLMGMVTINQILGITKDNDFTNYLNSQLNEYTQINEQAQKLLNENGCDEKGISTLEKVRTYLMINIQTLTDKSSSHIAEMLIVGSNMGIINAIKNLKKYSDANTNIKELMEKLLKFEENNVQELKRFL